jgi:peroxiredoxin
MFRAVLSLIAVLGADPPADLPAVPAVPPGVAAPEFAGVTAWVNGEPLTMNGLRGKVVVLHFWTFGCVNCQHNYATYRAWQEKYADKGVVLVGVHTPEFPAEANLARVKAKAKANKLVFPIAVDNTGQTWRAWGNRFWPTVYLIDKSGAVRYRWEGELTEKGMKGDEAMARKIDELLAEKP